MKTDFVLSEFEAKILEAYPGLIAQKVTDAISAGRGNGLDYEPNPLRTIDVPKRDFTVRPGAIPTIRDRVYYQALCDALAPTIESKLAGTQILFSYRLVDAKGPQMFRLPSESYAEFSATLNKHCEDPAYAYVVDADVASYFEHIDHHPIVNTLHGFGCEPVLVEAVGTLLRKWRNGVSHGIPQGLWPSDLIGNFYLSPLDSHMILERWQYVRYVDDIRIFTKSLVDARRALLSMSRKLGALGLSLNSEKTSILPKEEFCKKLRPASEKLVDLVAKRKAWMKALDPYFSEFKPSSESPLEKADVNQLLEILRDATSEHPVKEGDVKFCLNSLFGINAKEARVTATNLLADYPHLTSYVVNFLASTGYDPDIGQQLVTFLSSENNLYDWQEMWILRYFFTAKGMPKDLRAFVRNIVVNRNKNNATRTMAIHLLGELGELADWQSLREQVRNEDSNWVRAYIVLGTRKLPKDDRNHVYTYWRTLDWELELAIRFIKEILGPN